MLQGAAAGPPAAASISRFVWQWIAGLAITALFGAALLLLVRVGGVKARSARSE